MLIETGAPLGAPSDAPGGASESVLSAPSTVEVYDFGRPATLPRENTRVLEAAFEQFSRQWSSLLSAKIRTRTHVTVDLVTMQTYDEYASSLPATTAMVVCALPDTDERVVVQFPLDAALAWIVQMVGGTPLPTEERPFTPIELALLRSVMTETIDHLSTALVDALPSGLSYFGIQYNSQFAQVANAGDPVIVATFTMRLADRIVPATVMLPAAVVLARFSGHAVEDHTMTPDRMRRQVEASPIELALRLVPRPISSDEVLNLSVGDLVSFPHSVDRPIDLVAGGLTVASAAVGTNGARLACVITETSLDPAPGKEPA